MKRTDFKWIPNATISIGATTATGATPVALTGYGSRILVTNTGTSRVYIELSKTTTILAKTATSSVTDGSMPILQGTQVTIPRDGALYVAAVSTTGTQVVNFTPGEWQ